MRTPMVYDIFQHNDSNDWLEILVGKFTHTSCEYKNSILCTSQGCATAKIPPFGYALITQCGDASRPLAVAFGGSALWLRLVLEETQALMGATRLASGKYAAII